MCSGVIENCGECCVHKLARADSDILGLLRRGDRVSLLIEFNRIDYYYVYSNSGLEGFVSKDFIVIGQT